MKKTLAVGHFLNADFQSACARHLGRIRETFFAWPGVLSCRPAPDFTPEVRGCVRANDCTHCGRCAALMGKVFR